MKNLISQLSVYVVLTILMGVLMLMTNEAWSQTSDGQTPAQEPSCDSFTGAAYGLCVAYCEAMDCNSASPQASDDACARVAEQFERITGNLPSCPVCSQDDITLCGGSEFICPSGIKVCTRVFDPVVGCALGACPES